MKKLSVLTVTALCIAAVFSVFCFPRAGDISILAFIISAAGTAATAYYTYAVLLRDEPARIPIVHKLFQYLPYIMLIAFILRRAGKNDTARWYDVVTVILWCLLFVATLGAVYLLNEKRVYACRSSWTHYIKNYPPGGKKRKWIITEILEWLDAIVQAVFTILLVQIFILQLYVIPSESMVPQFLIGDRVFVFKTASGPQFPLSDVGLPVFRTYKRGDVVVFRNPHYRMDRQSEVKTVTSQLLYMLTLTLVNLNRDEHGELKADPLVKRICGLPGEQLVMQDGTLYARTRESPEFFPVESDARFATWNLHTVPLATRRGIQTFPVSSAQFQSLLDCEAERRELHIPEVAERCRSIAAAFSRIAPPVAEDDGSLTVPLFEYELFTSHEAITRRLLSETGGVAWFTAFMTDWIVNAPSDDAFVGGDIYSDANYRLNLMIKECFGQIVVRDAELITSGASGNIFSDDELYRALERAEQLHRYVVSLDQRNMPLFPPNAPDGTPNYLESDSYFMMGDNRFNSLDMRHSYNRTLVPLTALDDFSVTYYSNSAPQAVKSRYILGNAVFRFWPRKRIGLVQTK